MALEINSEKQLLTRIKLEPSDGNVVCDEIQRTSNWFPCFVIFLLQEKWPEQMRLAIYGNRTQLFEILRVNSKFSAYPEN